MRNKHTCLKCYYQWFSELSNPVKCAKCNNPNWNTPLIKKDPIKTKEDEYYLPIDSNQTYLISNYGKVYSNVTGRNIAIKSNSVSLPLLNNKKKRHTISHLVLKTFKPELQSTGHVHYIDGDRSNDVLSNIRWNI